jgi:DNA polymerase III epsilon subunit-like protein
LSCPALIDFEASCLPDYGQSYPIEVALARSDGSSRAWLIRPVEAWRYWDWSPEAEALHGISRALLETQGLTAEHVLDEMADFAKDCRVYADADLDQYWLEVLCQAVRRPLPFPVHHLGELLQEHRFTRDQVAAAVEAARKRLPRQHLARDDAQRLALMVNLLVNGEV